MPITEQENKHNYPKEYTKTNIQSEIDTKELVLSTQNEPHRLKLLVPKVHLPLAHVGLALVLIIQHQPIYPQAETCN